MMRLERLAGGLLEAGWLTTVVVTPLFIDKNGGDVFDGAKSGLVRTLALLMLAAWAMRALASMSRADAAPALQSARAWLRVPLIAATLAVVLTYALSTCLSLVPAESFWGIPGRCQGLLTLCAYVAIFAATLANLESREQLRRLLTALILPSIPIAAYAIVQRMGMEPLFVALRETDKQRATSLLGQPVFLGAYLGMIIPFTVVRLYTLLRATAAAGSHRRLAIGVHALVLLMQLAAILVTESRGPLLGLFSGVAFAALVIAARHDHRRLLIGVAVCGALGLGTVMGVAPWLRNSPSASPEVRRIATRASDLFAVAGGGGQFRTTTWGVALRVLTGAEPVPLADGGGDARAKPVRWLVGYGPELQYAVAPPSYDDDLPKLFTYFLADRFHNDLWDALIVTGALGLSAALALQSALLWSLFRGLGLLVAPHAGRRFWGAWAGGAALGALAWTLWLGLPFVFLGLQLGALAGLALLLVTMGIRRGKDATAKVDDEPIFMAVLVAMVGHVIETSFSFTVTTTGVLFWLFAALLVALPRIAQAEQAGGPRRAAAASSADPAAWRDPIALGALHAMVMLTLGYVFLGALKLSPKPGDLLWESLTVLSEPRGKQAPVVMVLVLGSWLLGALLLALSPRGEGLPLLFGRRLRWSLGIAGVIGTAYWLRLATLLARRGSLASIPGLHAEHNIELRAEAIASFYVWTALVVLLAALHLGGPARLVAAIEGRWLRGAASLACVSAAVFLVYPCALRPAYAEAASALGNALRDQQKLPLAQEAFARAAALRPQSDEHQASLGKAYHRQAGIDRVRAQALYQLANQALLKAIATNPAASENATNLAITRSNWAQHTRSRQLRATVPELYRRAIRMNPRDPRVWQSWAATQMRLLHDPVGALQSAQRATSLDPASQGAKSLLAKIETAIAARGDVPDVISDFEQVRR